MARRVDSLVTIRVPMCRSAQRRCQAVNRGLIGVNRRIGFTTRQEQHHKQTTTRKKETMGRGGHDTGADQPSGAAKL